VWGRGPRLRLGLRGIPARWTLSLHRTSCLGAVSEMHARFPLLPACLLHPVFVSAGLMPARVPGSTGSGQIPVLASHGAHGLILPVPAWAGALGHPDAPLLVRPQSVDGLALDLGASNCHLEARDRGAARGLINRKRHRARELKLYRVMHMNAVDVAMCARLRTQCESPRWLHAVATEGGGLVTKHSSIPWRASK
jgi:hypothetical protein